MLPKSTSKSLSITFSGEEPEDEQEPAINTTKEIGLAGAPGTGKATISQRHTLQESIQRNLQQTLVPFNEANIAVTLAKLLSVVKSNEGIWQLQTGGRWAKLSTAELERLSASILQEHFQTTADSRRDKIIALLSSRVPEQLKHIATYADSTISASKSSLEALVCSSNFCHIVRTALEVVSPNQHREFERSSAEETDYFVMGKQLYHVAVGELQLKLQYKPVISTAAQLKTHQQHSLYTGDGSTEIGQHASAIGTQWELQLFKDCGSESIRLFKTVLGQALLCNRHTQNTVILITGEANNFVSTLQALAGSYGNSSLPIHAIAAGNLKTVSIRRLSFLSNSGRTLTRALLRLNEHHIKTLPIVVSPADELPFNLPGDWQVVKICFKSVAQDQQQLVRQTPTQLAQCTSQLMQWLLESETTAEAEAIPTFAQLKQHAIIEIMKQYVRENKWHHSDGSADSSGSDASGGKPEKAFQHTDNGNPENSKRQKVKVLIGVILKSVIQIARSLNYNILDIDQRTISGALETMGYHVTRTGNKLMVSPYLVQPTTKD